MGPDRTIETAADGKHIFPIQIHTHNNGKDNYIIVKIKSEQHY